MKNSCQSINNEFMPEHDIHSPVYLGRQPIFDREMNIFAYELLYRDSDENRANITSQNAATSTVILNLTTELGFTAATGDKTAFINLSKDFLTGEIALTLPSKKVVLEILEDTIVNDELIDGLQKLIGQGFSLALDDFVYSSQWERVLPLVDYIKVEIPALSREQIKTHVAQLKKYNVKLLAEKIESEEEYDFLRDCGFNLFQGYFLAKPKVIKENTIPVNKLSILSLLADLNNAEVEVDKLVKSISSDVSLCYKILRYINSAHYALVRKVESLHEAVTYVGLKKLKQWTMLVAVSNLSNKPDDLMTLTMYRAYMCEQLAEQLGKNDPQHFFYVGLLSTLDMLLGMPLKEILKTLPLSSETQDALLYFDGPAGKILECALTYEKGDWERINSLDLDISPQQLLDSFLKAGHKTNNSILQSVAD
ncbi:MAG: HDOD domain-containing protein [Gammaproteobacteria bacterium]|nr:HDOD domain-containing protein [Gammaproteobacteria bacterium]